ncbi:SusC/RagA family TonB-linked outer membrane protein [Xanthovirga aplysinae]|uniref:SusC/RagA family TonB-linked outer membrane protein n=1 Tax=Xanthovirga aplysinae TaxID=2529853 RepID=UPI0012BB56D4|nr:SusC/RagA family TonB-linked outer membrane protein [Xanthovirga aplysinae]MTI31051.1 SusC/RagA family TonB-linked outer membrane protein [Xanthovirga aplysinae]
MKKNVLLCFMLVGALFSRAFAQEKTITGTITSETDGYGIPGVNVLLKGTAIGTITDFDGKYSLGGIPQDGGILIFSTVGMESQEIEIGAQSVIDILMKEDVQQLSEVVVTAMGLKRDKAKLGYSVQEVNADKLEKATNTNAFEALSGKVAGVQITDAGSTPGAGVNVIIRGSTSLDRDNQPLYVVDGVPISNNDVNTVFAADFNAPVSTNRAVDINPDDIESMSVLKGASAAALYGAQAANGAIIITTKSGKGKDGLNVDFSISHAIEEVNKLPGITHKYARGRDGGYSNRTHWSWGPAYASNPKFPDGTEIWVDAPGDAMGGVKDVSGQPIPIFEDNFSRVWQKGSNTNVNLAVSGSTDKTHYYTSVSSLANEGIVKNSKYNRTSFMIRGGHKVTDRLKVEGSANYIRTNTHKFRQGSSGLMGVMAYWHHMWDVEGEYQDENNLPIWFSPSYNDPQWTMEYEGEAGYVNRLIGNMGVSYDVADWLTVSFKQGIDTYADERKEYSPFGSRRTTNNEGLIQEVRVNDMVLNSDLLFTGVKNLSDVFELNYVVGGNIYQTRYNQLFVRGLGLTVPGFDNIETASEQTVYPSAQHYLRMGVFADVTVGYDNYLYLGLTGRNDFSSSLPSDNNSYFYPSTNLGFVFSELTDISWLSLGKLRASWARVGKDADPYSLSDVYVNRAPGRFGNLRYSLSDIKRNPELRPEITDSWELGTDLRFFDGKLSLDLSYYNTLSKDQIVEVPVSTTTGYGSMIQNAGTIQNKGIEAVLAINNPIEVNGLNWDLSFNFTKNENTVKEIAEGLDNIVLGTGWWSSATIEARVGEPYQAIYGVGFEKDENGNTLVDADGYPVIASEAQKLGNVLPDWNLGINNSLSYKGLTLAFLIDIKKGGDIVNGTKAALQYSGLHESTGERYYDGDPHSTATTVVEGMVVDAEGNSTGVKNTKAIPMDNGYWHDYNVYVDETLVEDASWVRLRNVSLTYSIPKKLFGRAPFKSIDFTLSGRNLFLWTPYTGVDPEVSAMGVGNAQGYDELSYPGTKSYSASLKLKF